MHLLSRRQVLLSLAGLPALAGCGSSVEVPLIAANRGRWEVLPASPLPPLEFPVAVWTGLDVVVTGLGADRILPAHAAAYRPATRTWRALPAPDVVRPPYGGHASAIWTGKDVVVLGYGYCHAFDPAAGTWRRLGDQGGLASVTDFSAVWTGDHVLVWGLDAPTAGWSIDPSTDTWAALPKAPVDSGNATGAWTGAEFVVQSGAHTRTELEFEPPIAYDPAKRTWRTLPAMPEARALSVATVWTGREVVVIGGTVGEDTYLPKKQSAYDPVKNTWRDLAAGGSPAFGARMGHRAVWTGRQVLVWGGGRYDFFGPQGAKFVPAPDDAAYDPVSDTWATLPKSPLQGRTDPAAVWAGTSLVVWGGGVFPGGSAAEPPRAAADGAVYTP